MTKHSLKQENPIISDLVLNAIRIEVPEIYQKILDITNLIFELDEKTWKEQSDFVTELQNDIISNLCQLFRAQLVENQKAPEPVKIAVTAPVNLTAKIIHSQRNANPLMLKQKSDSFLVLKTDSKGVSKDLSEQDGEGIVSVEEGHEQEEEEDHDEHDENKEKDDDELFQDNEDPFAKKEAITSIEDVDLDYLYPEKEENPNTKEDPDVSYDVFENSHSDLKDDSGFEEFSAESPNQPMKGSSTDPFDHNPTSSKLHAPSSGSMDSLQSSSSATGTSVKAVIREDQSFYNPFFFTQQEKKKFLFSCPICLTGKLSIDGSIEMEVCNHRFCYNCIKRYIQKKIHSKEIKENQMICPCDSCTTKISTFMIQGIVDPIDWEKYQEYSTLSQLEHECFHGLGLKCPNQLCKNIFFFESIEEKKQMLDNPNNLNGFHFFCDARLGGCNQSFCIKCKGLPVGEEVGPSHLPYSCLDYKKRLAELPDEKLKYERWKRFSLTNTNAQFQKLVENERLRACPVCSVMIQKTEGCDHMHCSICNCNFCYVCGKYNLQNPTKRGDCGPTHGDRNWSHPDN